MTRGARLPTNPDVRKLGRTARALRAIHGTVGVAELGCLGYLWTCALLRRRDRWLRLAVGVLIGEGVALLAAGGCPLGIFQQRAGDDVPMFELWFGPRLAPVAIPFFTIIATTGMVLAYARPPWSPTPAELMTTPTWGGKGTHAQVLDRSDRSIHTADRLDK